LVIDSSSTVGLGATSASKIYVERLERDLESAIVGVNFTVVGRGISGEVAQGAADRMRREVEEVKPDLVIWQVGTNDAVKGGDIEAFRGMVREGIRLVKQANTPLAILDPQFFPTVRDSDNYKRFVAAVGDVARREAVPVFSRYETMREWHDSDAEAFKAALWSDGFHMSDAGYDCLARDMANALVGMTAPSRPVVASAR
jgi:lysophospholipase L1-like esterase